MANLSDAWGTIRVTCPNGTLAHAFLTAYAKEAGRWQFGTDICVDYVSEHMTGSGVQLEAEFFGTGRWAYMENIEWTFTVLTENIKPDDMDEALFDELKKSRLIVEYEFTDYEFGCEILYTALIRTTYNNGVVTEPETVKLDNHEFTLENFHTYVSTEFYGKQTVIEDIQNGEITYVKDFTRIINEKTMDELHEVLTNEDKKTKLLELVEENAPDTYFDEDAYAFFDNGYEDFADDIRTAYLS